MGKTDRNLAKNRQCYMSRNCANPTLLQKALVDTNEVQKKKKCVSLSNTGPELHFTKTIELRVIFCIFQKDQYLGEIERTLNSICLEFTKNTSFFGKLHQNSHDGSSDGVAKATHLHQRTFAVVALMSTCESI